MNIQNLFRQLMFQEYAIVHVLSGVHIYVSLHWQGCVFDRNQSSPLLKRGIQFLVDDELLCFSESNSRNVFFASHQLRIGIPWRKVCMVFSMHYNCPYCGCHTCRCKNGENFVLLMHCHYCKCKCKTS